MIEQLKTIREALERLSCLGNGSHYGNSDGNRIAQEVLPLARQLESLVGEQEPVAYGMLDTQLGRQHRMMMVRLDKGQDGCTVPLYLAAPVAQQYEAGDVASAAAQGFRDGVASVAQQPSKAQLETLRAWETSGELIDRAWSVLQSQEQEIMRLEKTLAEERAQQPQAEAMPVAVLRRGEGGAFSVSVGDYLLAVYALPPGNHDLFTRPQQAEAVQYTRADLDRAYSAGLVEGERLAIQQAEAAYQRSYMDGTAKPCADYKAMYLKVRDELAALQQSPCPTCVSLARAVMMEQRGEA